MENITLEDRNASAEEKINSFYFYETEQFILLWILFTAIVLGNSAVLAALLLNKTRKSRMKFFIMHLAIADLSVGLISVLTDIVWRLTVSWNAGNAACKIIRFLQCTVTYSSTYVLVALSVDRYDAITHPMNFSGSWRRARLLVATAWMLSFVFSIPIIIFYEEKRIENQLQCWIEFPHQWQWQVYMTLVSLTLFVIPAIIISGCYLFIVITIWNKSQLMRPVNRPTHDLITNSDPISESEPDCRRASSRGIIPKAKIKTVKMTFGIVFVFIICWSPYIVFDLLQVYGFVPRTQTNIAIASFIQSLAPLNSAANPLIYCLFSTHICRGIRKVPPLAWLLCCVTGNWSENPTCPPPWRPGRPGRRRRGGAGHGSGSGRARGGLCTGTTDSSSVTETLTSSSAKRNPASLSSLGVRSVAISKL